MDIHNFVGTFTRVRERHRPAWNLPSRVCVLVTGPRSRVAGSVSGSSAVPGSCTCRRPWLGRVSGRDLNLDRSHFGHLGQRDRGTQITGLGFSFCDTVSGLAL